jgi:hypothetical protein
MTYDTALVVLSYGLVAASLYTRPVHQKHRRSAIHAMIRDQSNPAGGGRRHPCMATN